MPTNKNLIVPISVEALCVGKGDVQREFVTATVDFSQMPWRDGDDYINVKPNIGEYLMQQPFEGDAPLDPGIHLHWALPQALSHGIYNDKTEKIEFPTVPNRWLVVRVVDGNSAATKSWLIESDYLSTTGQSNSATVPVDPTENEPRPYRYLGKVFRFENWQESEEHEHFPNLTAIGAGEATFAAFYPNCVNVFGFYDHLSDLSNGFVKITYHVVGWYSEVENDPLSQIGTGKKYKKWDEFKAAYKWAFDESNVKQLLCTGEITQIAWDPTSYKQYEQNKDSGIKIAIGNNPSEALSALLATQFKTEPHVERIFNALQSGRLAELNKQGGFEELEYDLQQKSFSAIPGGHIWLIRKVNNNASIDTNEGVQEETLPECLAHDLNELNMLQQQYDRAQDEIANQRWQIFADWYKYMVVEYAPNKDHLVDINRIYDFIKQTIEDINNKLERTGTLQVKSYEPTLINSVPGSNTLANKIVNKINGTITEQLTQINSKLTSKNEQYQLQRAPTSRYWQPNDPVILIADDGTYAQSPQCYDASVDNLSCQTTDNLFNSDDTINKTALQVSNLETKRSELFFGIGTKSWETNPWLPLFLQWEIQYHPVRKMDDQDGYPHDTISAGFDVHEDYLDLRYNNKHSPSGLDTYSGSIILTPHATWRLKHEIDRYLDSYPKDEKPPIGEEQQADNELWDELQTLSKNLRSRPILSQALGGFNAALMMRKPTLCRPVCDPLVSSPGLAQFHEKVKQAVAGYNTHAPMPENYYNPIRGGFMRLSQVRIVDVFGQMKTVDGGLIIRAESMKSSSDKQQTEVEKNHILVPPRITQPARLQFRWISADENQIEMNTHPASTPICGWVLPNYLDKSLLIYNNKGKYIGYLALTPDETREVWHSAPGQSEVDIRTAFASENPHLRDFAVYIYNDGIPRGFLPEFFRVTDRVLTHINPQNHKQHQTLTVLVGRPLALVRASLKLELKGLPAYCQNWNAFANDVQKGNPQQRETRGFTQVKFPVRLGDTLNINDGLVGYFNEDNRGQVNYQFFYAPLADDSQIEEVHPPKIYTDVRHPEADTIKLDCAPESKAQTLTMLIDPRAKVHATTHILPVKFLEIPPDLYVKALKAIEVSFVAGPIISDATQLAFPLPTEVEGEWSWIRKQDPHTWVSPSDIAKVNDRATLSHKRQQISEGWLQFHKNNSSSKTDS